MRFVILRLLRHNELGMFHAYRRLGKEGSKQRAINFDGDVIDRVFPTVLDHDVIDLELAYESDEGIRKIPHRIKRQKKNWRLEGNCPKDDLYQFVEPGCLFAMVVDARSKPATGAWAVFPEDDDVTAAITSHSESSSLTSSSMIALYGSEGGHTLDLLQKAKPELFGQEERLPGEAIYEADGAEGDQEYLPPNPRRLVRILASVGHSFPSAVADIVDNAISAHATQIDIQFPEPDQGRGRWMAITDNGSGMSRPALSEAMRIGSDSRYASGDLGKYGYGLKGASWSQAESFTVATRVADGHLHHLSWNDDEMDDWNASRHGLEEWMKPHITIGAHGTCVFWRDMRPPRQAIAARGVAPHTAEIRDLGRHLGLVFHRFIEGVAKGRRPVKIQINGQAIESNSPTGHPLTEAYDLKPIQIQTPTSDARVEVQAFLLPTEDQIKEYHDNDVDASRRDLERIGLYGKRNETQGVFVYRHDRLIQWGGWHELWKTCDEKTKLARVVVEFDENLDDHFSVNISKRQVSLPMQLQTHIRQIAELARKDSRSRYKKKGPRVGSGNRPASSSASSTSVPGATQDKASVDAVTPQSNPAIDTPRIRTVRNPDFAWKISEGMTGEQELQISEIETDLWELYQAIKGDPGAAKKLMNFLRRLDDAQVQSALRDSSTRA